MTDEFVGQTDESSAGPAIPHPKLRFEANRIDAVSRTSLIAPADLTRFTSQRIVDAERRVLESTTEDAPFAMDAVIDPILGDDQADAVTAITAI